MPRSRRSKPKATRLPWIPSNATWARAWSAWRSCASASSAVEQAEANLALVVSEQERLDQQIKLIRADAVATKNAETLTARIDATVEHLDQTNKWLSEMDEFKDLVGDMPSTELRVGYQATATPLPTATTIAASAPPIIEGVPFKKSYPARQKQR